MSQTEPDIGYQRPPAVSDILEGGARLAFRHLLAFLRITAPLTLPFGLLLGAVIVWRANSAGSRHLATGILVPVAVVYAFTVLVAGAACLKLANAAHGGAGPSARAAIDSALRRLGPAIFVSALLLVGVAPAVALLALPGVTALGNYALLLLAAAIFSLWFSATFSLTMPALLVEEKGIVESLCRSAALTRGSFWRALGTVVLGGILALFAGVLVAILVSVFSLGGGNVVLIVKLAGLVLGLLFVAPLYASFLTVFYEDRRAREQARVASARPAEPSPK
ncbi:MAG: hypothetical protein ACYDHO_01960 [Gaiellaceae bacterium]